MYIVTGGAGFIGSSLIKKLNEEGITDILLVDNLSDDRKIANIYDLDFNDYIEKNAFRNLINTDGLTQAIDAVFHQGACTDTMERDGHYMMDNNYSYSKDTLHFCAARNIPFIYASSASVYGSSTEFVEDPDNEHPLHIYGYSKLLFDRYVRKNWDEIGATVVGLRYFNVYGAREGHKGRMASMVYRLYHQLEETGIVKLFGENGTYPAGEQRRDFISVDDVVSVNLFMAAGEIRKGIYNLGTGISRTFNDIGNTLIELAGSGKIDYIPFPEDLLGKYQSFTEANIAALRSSGYDKPFYALEEGIGRVYRILSAHRRSEEDRTKGSPS